MELCRYTVVVSIPDHYAPSAQVASLEEADDANLPDFIACHTAQAIDEQIERFPYLRHATFDVRD
jgi:hypothetical protein